MESQARDFARYGHWQGMMFRFDFWRNTHFGSTISGLHGRYSNVLFATDAFGTILMTEAFPGSIREYQCLRQSLLYAMFGGHAAQPAVGFRVPLVMCRKRPSCLVPGPIACFGVFDNNADLETAMFTGDTAEPHFLSPVLRVFDYYREQLCGKFRAFNELLENKRMNIETRMSVLMKRFPVLVNPEPGMGITPGGNPDYIMYNELLQVITAISNQGVTEDSRHYQAPSPTNALTFLPPPNAPHDVDVWAINHICDCEMDGVEEKSETWYPRRLMEISQLLRPSRILQSIIWIYTRGMNFNLNSGQIGPHERQLPIATLEADLRAQVANLQAQVQVERAAKLAAEAQVQVERAALRAERYARAAERSERLALEATVRRLRAIH